MITLTWKRLRFLLGAAIATAAAAVLDKRIHAVSLVLRLLNDLNVEFRLTM
jgi:hypothetical protein